MHWSNEVAPEAMSSEPGLANDTIGPRRGSAVSLYARMHMLFALNDSES